MARVITLTWTEDGQVWSEGRHLENEFDLMCHLTDGMPEISGSTDYKATVELLGHHDWGEGDE